jgi:histidinol-phosphate phosphatase family protein
MSTEAIFLDRDGVINKKPVSGKYIVSWEEFKVLPDVVEGIKLIRENNYLPIVATNQRGIAQGLVSYETIQKIHQNLNDYLKGKGTSIEKFYVCPHEYEDNCSCRKPKPGMLLEAASDFDVDLKKLLVHWGLKNRHSMW